MKRTNKNRVNIIVATKNFMERKMIFFLLLEIEILSAQL